MTQKNMIHTVASAQRVFLECKLLSDDQQDDLIEIMGTDRWDTYGWRKEGTDLHIWQIPNKMKKAA